MATSLSGILLNDLCLSVGFWVFAELYLSDHNIVPMRLSHIFLVL